MNKYLPMLIKWTPKSSKQCREVFDLPLEKLKASSKYPWIYSDLSIPFKKSTTSNSKFTCIAEFSGNLLEAWA